jgi:SAM-dependent methyltransferase
VSLLHNLSDGRGQPAGPAGVAGGTGSVPRPAWDRPTAYERWYASSLGRAYAASLDRALRPWLGQSAGCRVLDIGCGPGLLRDRLFPGDADVIGLDCSAEMVERALARSRPGGRARRFVVGSVGRLPFADGAFGLVFCVNCVEFVEDRSAAFAEMARVLRPSGSAVLGVLSRRSVWELTRRLRRPFASGPYYRGRFFRAQEVRACCTEVGLKVEEIKTAVHFPPFAPGPLSWVYDRMDRWCQRHSLGCGGVILCLAKKPG